MLINYKKIPGFSRLFLDYVNNFGNVEKFYSIDFKKENYFASLFNRVLANQKVKNKEIKEIILTQNKNILLSDSTLKNIEKLALGNTIAVVTGQQVGILGGPLYSVYKAITVIKLSNYLNDKFEDFNFVPVFWMATDDHDFREISSINLIDENKNLIKITYDDNLPREFNRGSVGNIKIKKTFESVFKQLEDVLTKTEYTQDLLSRFKEFYSQGKTYSQAFKELFNYLFGKYGLIIFDPSAPKVKELLKPVFKKEIANFRSNSDAVLLRSAVLEEDYHAQVKVRPINLFYSDRSGRRPVEPAENGLKLKRGKPALKLEQILNMIDENPQSFSPNVLLRPICQDYLLPTCVYVAGPSEIAYFAQVMPLYDKFNVLPPVILPRASVTIIEKNIGKILKKFKLKPAEMFLTSENFKKLVLKVFSEKNASGIFEKSTEELNSFYDNLKLQLRKIDSTLEIPVEKARAKALNNLNILKEKAVKAVEMNNQTAFRQIEKTRNLIFPEERLQERRLNIIYFLNKYGIEFIDFLVNNVAINKYEHQIIEM